MLISQMQARGGIAGRYLGALTLLACLSLTALLTGCSDDDERKIPTKLVDERDPNTPNYFTEAIFYDVGQGRWVLHSWRSPEAGGDCHIRINVYDAAQSVPDNLNRAAAKQAVEQSRIAWVKAIMNAGLDVKTYTRFVSEGDAMHQRLPRIDIRYVRSLRDAVGLCTGYTDGSPGTFSRFEIKIATGYVRHDGSYVTLSDEDVRETTLHELGHALGIFGWKDHDGHSSNQNDVMFASSIYGTLSNGDTKTMQQIYRSLQYYRPMRSTLAAGDRTEEVICSVSCP